MRKILSIILSITMLFSFLGSISVFAEENTPTIYIEDVKNASPGDTVTVYICVKNIPDKSFAGMYLVMDYDADKIKYKLGNFSNKIEGNLTLEAEGAGWEEGVDTFSIIHANSGNVKLPEDNRIFEFKFEIAEGVNTDDSICLTLGWDPAEDEPFLDQDSNNLSEGVSLEKGYIYFKQLPEIEGCSVSPETFTYGDGLEHKAEPTGTQDGDVITYQYQKVNADGTLAEAVTDAPVNAGQYKQTVTIKREGYKPLTLETTITINKATPEYAAPTDLQTEYKAGKTLADVQSEDILPPGWSWDDPTTVISGVGTYPYPATYTKCDANGTPDSNYQPVSGIPVTLEVVAHLNDVTGYADLTDAVYTYEKGTARSLTVAAAAGETPDPAIEAAEIAYYTKDANGSYTVPFTSAENAGIYDIEVRVTAEGYKVWKSEAILTINKAAGETEAEYADALGNLTAWENTNKVNYSYGKKLSDIPLPNNWAWVDPDTVIGKSDGTYDVKYIPNDKVNYNEGAPRSVSVDVEILPVKYTVGTGKGKQGENVEVYVRIANNPGVSSVKFDLTFDDTVMTLKGTKLQDNFKNAGGSLEWTEADGTINNIITGASNITVSEPMVCYTFKIADDAAEGEYPLNITVTETKDTENYEFTTEANGGSVTVREKDTVKFFTDKEKKGQPGDKVTITVYMEQNTPLAAFAYTLSFDTNGLEYVSCLKNAAITGNGNFVDNDSDYIDSGYIEAVWATTNNFVTADEEATPICSYTFKIKDTAAAGEIYSIAITPDAENTRNASQEEVKATSSGGIVRVISAAEAALQPRYEVSTAKGKAADTVDIMVKIFNNPGIQSFDLSLGYDNEKLELKNVKLNDSVPNSGGFISGSDIGSSIITAVWDGNGNSFNDNNDTDGIVLMTYTFKIKNTSVDPGNTPILLYEDLDNPDIGVISGGIDIIGTITGYSIDEATLVATYDGDAKEIKIKKAADAPELTPVIKYYNVDANGDPILTDGSGNSAELTPEDVKGAPDQEEVYYVEVTLSKPGYDDKILTGKLMINSLPTIEGYDFDENDEAFDAPVGKYEYTYDGQAKTPEIVKIPGTAATDGITIDYEYKDSEGNVSAIAPVDAGEYTVKVTLSKDGYNPITKEADMVINKAEIVGYDMNDMVFGINEAEIADTQHIIKAPNGTATEGVAISYEYGDSNYLPISEAAIDFSSPGTYYVKAILTKANYEDKDLGWKKIEITGNQSITGYSFVDKTVVYDGTPKELTVTKAADADPSDATITYDYYDSNGNRLTGIDAPPKELGTYKVVATISKPGYNALIKTAFLTIEQPAYGGGGGSVTRYTVRINDGENINEVKIMRGYSLKDAKVEVPVREGYVFAGWYKDPEFIERFDITQPVLNDMTLYVKWDKEQASEPNEGFEDVDGHWAESYINEMAEKNIFVGYEDGTFRPNQGITRQEIAIAVVKMLDLTDELGTVSTDILKQFSDFEDIAKWSEDYVAVTVDKMIFEGYKEGYFKPEQIILREQMCTVLSKIIGGALDKEAEFNDMGTGTSLWATSYIANMSEMGVVVGYEDGSFRGKNEITRAEAATMFSKFMNNCLNK